MGVSGTLGVAALKLAPPAAPGLSLDLQDLELRIDRLTVPGVLPPGEKAASGAGAEIQAVNSDIHASEDYRRAMIGVFAKRAVLAALSRA